MGAEEHKAQAPASVRCFVITVSDTRVEATDETGALIRSILTEAGHEVVGHGTVPDDVEQIRIVVRRKLVDPDVQAIILSGGSGISSRDNTPEALMRIFDKTLVGFGELFRMLSYQEIGSAALLSRAVAGTAGRTAIFALPGSPHAVRLGVTRLILPELGHVVRELTK